MKILLNGKEEKLPGALTIKELLDRRGVRPEMTAIELNFEIVKRKEYDQTVLKEDDKVEIVTMMGGG